MSPFSPEIEAQAMIPKELLGQASSLHFSLHLSNEGSEVALSEAAGGALHWASRIHEEGGLSNDFADSLKHRNWNEKIFRRCTISYDAEVFTLVPAGFFSANKASELLSFSSGKLCSKIGYAELPEWDAVLIWEESYSMSNVPAYFPNARLLPSAYLVMKHCNAIIDRNESTIAIMRSGSLLNLFVFKQGLPVMLNAHHVNDDEDVLYYTSHAAMTLGIDFENCRLNVYDRQEDISLINLLKHYNRNLTQLFAETSGSIHAGFISHLHILCA